MTNMTTDVVNKLDPKWGAGPAFGDVTKRELFAAMAMQGICGDGIPGSHHRPEDTARDAVAYADALLKELAK